MSNYYWTMPFPGAWDWFSHGLVIVYVPNIFCLNMKKTAPKMQSPAHKKSNRMSSFMKSTEKGTKIKRVITS